MTELKTSFSIPAHLCIKCRGTKMLCGLSYCPIMVSTYVKPKIAEIRKGDLSGSSPPSVFVGRFGYPKIKLYPSSPPVHGETSMYEDASKWLSIGMEEFLSMRLSLVRGGVDVKVKDASNPSSLFQDIQLMSLSNRPVEVEMKFLKNLNTEKMMLSEYVPPMGPSAPLNSIVTGNIKIENRVERAYYDTDLKAQDAMWTLYTGGENVSLITKALSTGSFGANRNRKAVPTRWSITAVDKNLSERLIKDIKHYESVDKYLAFARRVNGNLFLGILPPATWRFEWGESWFPGSAWNWFGTDPQVEIDYEGFWGRKDYPGIGGCYYASMLSVTEYLNSIKRQSAPILWREIYPGFNLPVGVWFVRENLREMFRQKPVECETLEQALQYISGFMKVPLRKWVENSGVIPMLRARTLESFF